MVAQSPHHVPVQQRVGLFRLVQRMQCAQPVARAGFVGEQPHGPVCRLDTLLNHGCGLVGQPQRGIGQPRPGTGQQGAEHGRDLITAPAADIAVAGQPGQGRQRQQQLGHVGGGGGAGIQGLQRHASGVWKLGQSAGFQQLREFAQRACPAGQPRRPRIGRPDERVAVQTGLDHPYREFWLPAQRPAFLKGAGAARLGG